MRAPAPICQQRKAEEAHAEAEHAHEQHGLAADALAQTPPGRADQDLHQRVACRERTDLELAQAELAPERRKDRKQYAQPQDAVEERDEE